MQSIYFFNFLNPWNLSVVVMSYLRFEPPQPERMDFYETQMQIAVNSRPSRQKGKRLTEDQVRLLEKSFGSNKKLDPERKLQLAVELGVPPRQVAIWYQNKRARWKTQTLEIDYNALKEKLQSAIAEKRELERDVERLRAELRNARDMLALAGLNHHQVPEPDNNNNNNNNKVIVPSSCSNYLSWSSEVGGGISATNNSFNEPRHDHRHVNGCWEEEEEEEEEDKTLHFDDLYACLMFGTGSSPSDC